MKKDIVILAIVVAFVTATLFWLVSNYKIQSLQSDIVILQKQLNSNQIDFQKFKKDTVTIVNGLSVKNKPITITGTTTSTIIQPRVPKYQYELDKLDREIEKFESQEQNIMNEARDIFR